MNYEDQQYEEIDLGLSHPTQDEEVDTEELVMEDEIESDDYDETRLLSSSSNSSTTSNSSLDDYPPTGVKYNAVVEALRQGGKSYALIAKETGIPKSTVGSIKRRWTTKGNIDDGRKHNGRPPKLTPKQIQLIETTLRDSQDTLSSTELLKILKFDVSARTIRRAKRAIFEKRCQESRDSVIMAARSLAAASQYPALHHHVPHQHVMPPPHHHVPHHHVPHHHVPHHMPQMMNAPHPQHHLHQLHHGHESSLMGMSYI